ncbi:MBL fold metallo-hydrolase [Clostridium aminobutyricum]|uniref:MBL fold metallo-hydrolase n=1 Tax=Clostridium aminobutyricum TaxID=33953 RepID=A0A939D5X5_CLOAM|nr:MBL fold metallo-hydrolase [Clostridium aminobutyricum]MBN7772029.1 MBL fold metallo-hydrolase [Clostridium aminobutyricum]
MKIKRIVGGNLESNGYILYQNEGGHCFVIDPGYNAEKFAVQIQKMKLTADGILLTHHHYDHTGAVDKLSDLVECPIYMHWGDLEIYRGTVHHTLEDGDVLVLDGENIKVLHTPGHTEGSVCFYSEDSKLVFTGDTIFNIDLGRTDLEDGSDYKMEQSIRDVIDKWENDIMIYPGHGDSCTMKYVRQHNKEFLDIIER